MQRSIVARIEYGWLRTRMPRIAAWLILGCLAACATHAPPPTPAVPPPAVVSAPPATTRGAFTVAATKLDTWNAVGQIVVNTPGLEYLGRSQMLDLYTVRYRGQEFLLLTKALQLSDTVTSTTTQVTAATPDGKPIDSDASADLLAQLQQALPAAIDAVHVRQAAEAAAKQAATHKTKAKRRGRKK